MLRSKVALVGWQDQQVSHARLVAERNIVSDDDTVRRVCLSTPCLMPCIVQRLRSLCQLPARAVLPKLSMLEFSTLDLSFQEQQTAELVAKLVQYAKASAKHLPLAAQAGALAFQHFADSTASFDLYLTKC